MGKVEWGKVCDRWSRAGAIVSPWALGGGGWSGRDGSGAGREGWGWGEGGTAQTKGPEPRFLFCRAMLPNYTLGISNPQLRRVVDLVWMKCDSQPPAYRITPCDAFREVGPRGLATAAPSVSRVGNVVQ